jgi:hypothetical protein
MARRLFTLLSALSLLLCAAVCVLWVRSYNAGDNLQLRMPFKPYTLCRLHGGFGRVSFGLIRYDEGRPLRREDEAVFRYWTAYPFSLTELRPQSQLGRLGFDCRGWESGYAGGSTVWWLVVPSWMVVATALQLGHSRCCDGTALVPLASARTAATTSAPPPARCPECGTAAAVKAA